MLTRSKQLFRRDKTIDDPARQNEKYSLRILEECKQIPKNDRLELRKHIRGGCDTVIELFRKHRSNLNLNTLQIGLRKYIAKCKLALQNELIESFKSSALNSPRMLNAGIKIVEEAKIHKKRVSRSLENNSQQHYVVSNSKPTKIPLTEIKQMNNIQAKERHAEQHELSVLQKENISRLLGRQDSSAFLSKTLIGSASSCHLAGSQIIEGHETIEDKYRTQPPMNTQRQEIHSPTLFTSEIEPCSAIYTDPKLMEECRQILSRVHLPQANWGSVTTNYIFAVPTDLSAASVLLDPRLIFGGREAQTVMDDFFHPQVRLTKESFVYRMKDYLQKHIPSNNYAQESIENYFDVLSMNGSTLEITRFGKELDLYCMKRIPAHPIRKLFNELDPSGFGYLGRHVIHDERWQTLFKRADTAGKGIIEYWDLYGARKSWEFISFSIWQQQQRLI